MAGKALTVLAAALLATFSASAQRVVASIPLRATPFGVAVNPFKNRIYVATVDSSTGKHALAVIDGRTNAQVATVSLPAATLVAVNVVTHRVYVAGCNFPQTPIACTLSVVDGDQNQLLTTIPISSNAAIGLQGLAVNPITDLVYVSDADALKIDVIDGKTNMITTSISLGGQQPLGLAVDFLHNRLVAVINGPLIAVIDGRDNAILQRVTVGASNANVAVNPITERAYVTNEDFAPSTVGVVDIEHFTVVTNVPVGNNPFGVALDEFSRIVFVTNLNDQTVSVINGRRNRVVATVHVFGRYVDVNPIRRLAYVSDDFSQAIHVISERDCEDDSGDESECEE
jgi:YVTN family beta-propeller protein